MKNKPVEIVAGSGFVRDLKRLRKHYPHVTQDVKPVSDQLEAGETPGDRIQGLVDIVYKVRIPNRDARKGKRGGYRMLYYFRSGIRVYLLILYAKNERADVPLEQVRRLIEELRAEIGETPSPDQE